MESSFILRAAPRVRRPAPHLVALIRSPADHQLLSNVVPRNRIVFCSSGSAVLSESDGAAGIVCEAGVLDPLSLARLADSVAARGGACLLVLRVRPDRRHLHDLLAVTRTSAAVLVSLSDHDDLAALAQRVLSGDEPSSCTTHLVGRVEGVIPVAAREIVCGTLALGAKRTAVGVLAQFVGLSERTLTWWLRRAGAPHARTLLAWSLGLHLTWRTAILRWPLKRAASVAGFSDGRSCARYLRRNLDRSPRCLEREVGFWELASEFERMLSGSRPMNASIPAAETDPFLRAAAVLHP